MSIKWIKTAHTGLRYYEHQKRKIGIQKDRYYAIRFRVDKKLYSYGVGWLSEGIPETIRQEEPELGFQDYCLKLLRAYKGNVKTGAGPKSPKEKRKIAEEKEAAEKVEAARQEKAAVTFGQYFKNTYSPTHATGKKKNTRKDDEHFKNWIEPIIGNTPAKDVKPFMIERIKKNVLDAGRAPRTLQYIFATIRQCWNMAKRDGLVAGDSPTKSVKKPKIDNKRVRFLSHKEAETLLKALQTRDALTHDLALLSLHAGLRMGEIAKLKWSHIDLDREIIAVLDTKTGKGRAAFMTGEVKTMFKAIADAGQKKKPDDYVFTRGKNEQLKDTPKVFAEVVASLGLNTGITDRRQRVYFHSLRHTFASWHVTAGTDIYTVKELLGHSVIAMTERYSHLAPGTLQNATRTLERAISEAGQEKTEEQAEKVVNFPT
jgi:integrase